MSTLRPLVHERPLGSSPANWADQPKAMPDGAGSQKLHVIGGLHRSGHRAFCTRCIEWKNKNLNKKKRAALDLFGSEFSHISIKTNHSRPSRFASASDAALVIPRLDSQIWLLPPALGTTRRSLAAIYCVCTLINDWLRYSAPAHEYDIQQIEPGFFFFLVHELGIPALGVVSLTGTPPRRSSTLASHRRLATSPNGSYRSCRRLRKARVSCVV